MLLPFEDGPLLTAVPCGRETRIHTGNLQSRKSILDAFQSLSGFEGRTEWFWMVIIGFVNICFAWCGLRELANTSASRTPWGNASYGTFWLEFLNSKKWISFPVTGWTLQCSLFSPKVPWEHLQPNRCSQVLLPMPVWGLHLPRRNAGQKSFWRSRMGYLMLVSSLSLQPLWQHAGDTDDDLTLFTQWLSSWRC